MQGDLKRKYHGPNRNSRQLLDEVPKVSKRKYHGPNVISPSSNVILNIILGIGSLLCVLPVLLLVVVSFTDEKTIILKGFSFLPKKLSLYAYEFIFSTGAQIFNSFLVSIFVTVVGTILSLLIIALYAYPISRKDFKFKNFFTFFLFFTMLFNGGLVSWYLISVQVLHLKDNPWGLIFPYLVNAWWVLILRTYYATTIPDSIIESAKIDGAGELRTFFSIVMPLSLPGLATIGLFSTLQYWNDWWLGLMLINEPKLTPLPYLLYRVQNAIQYLIQNSGIQSDLAGDILTRMPSQTSRMAMVVIGITPILMVFPFFQKYFIKGLTVGAIKG